LNRKKQITIAKISRTASRRFEIGKSPVERRSLALCRLMKTKGLALLPAVIKGPNAIAIN